jgi:hypothetical protein
MAIPKALTGSKCARCKGFILYRPDALPFCSECQKKIEAEIKNRVPKVRNKVMVSEKVAR